MDRYTILEYIYSTILLIVLILYVILAIIAFFYSLMCIGSDSTTSDKLIGLFLMLFTGPCYFIFYIYNTKYCVSTVYIK
jgi:hypothetical protein